MATKLFQLLIRAYFGGPRKSWLILSTLMVLFRLGRSLLGRREIVDLSSTKPGDTILIKHLDTSHKKQIKQGSSKKSKRRSELSAWLKN